MEQDAVPCDEALIWPTIKALKELGGSGTIGEINEKIVELEGYSEVLQAELMPNGTQTKLAYRSAWARTNLKKGGYADNPSRGLWVLLEKGQKTLDGDEEKIINNIKRANKEDNKNKNKKFAPERKGQKEILDAQPQEDDWRDGLLRVLRDMAPDAFERLAQRLLREGGFIDVNVTGKSGDGGIDGVGILRMGLVSFPIVFQCKRYQGSITPEQVRGFRGAMIGRADKGLFITTGSFTAEARREATRAAPFIDLIDGDTLCDLLKERGLGVVERVQVDAAWFAKI
ncbi:MAG TPA: restriction endonuclease [Rhodospirillaceae bacterium]|jgi:restriction system protein|nr:restriction endonuclease [Alphaproteobacteria bacterium]HBH26101.1 restriction endonuclease [Rhodospirillaceae bacterium]